MNFKIVNRKTTIITRLIVICLLVSLFFGVWLKFKKVEEEKNTLFKEVQSLQEQIKTHAEPVVSEELRELDAKFVDFRSDLSPFVKDLNQMMQLASGDDAKLLLELFSQAGDMAGDSYTTAKIIRLSVYSKNPDEARREIQDWAKSVNARLDNKLIVLNGALVLKNLKPGTVENIKKAKEFNRRFQNLLQTLATF